MTAAAVTRLAGRLAGCDAPADRQIASAPSHSLLTRPAGLQWRRMCWLGAAGANHDAGEGYGLFQGSGYQSHVRGNVTGSTEHAGIWGYRSLDYNTVHSLSHVYRLYGILYSMCVVTVLRIPYPPTWGIYRWLQGCHAGQTPSLHATCLLYTSPSPRD